MLQQLSHASQLQLGSYSDVLMPWFDGSSGRVVAIGDHAHATSPQLGQGANLALVDALTLADALADAGAGAPPAAADARRAAVRTALRAYTRARRVRIHFYQLQSRLLTPLFASPSTAVAAVRDVAMPLACSWGPTLRRHSKYSSSRRRRRRGLRCGERPPRQPSCQPKADAPSFTLHPDSFTQVRDRRLMRRPGTPAVADSARDGVGRLPRGIAATRRRRRRAGPRRNAAADACEAAVHRTSAPAAKAG